MRMAYTQKLHTHTLRFQLLRLCRHKCHINWTKYDGWKHILLCAPVWVAVNCLLDIWLHIERNDGHFVVVVVEVAARTQSNKQSYSSFCINVVIVVSILFFFLCSSLCRAPNFAFFRLISFWWNCNFMLMHHVGSLTLFDCYCLKYQIMSVAEHSLHRANCEEKAADTQHRTSNEILSSPRLMCLNYVSGISSFCSSLTKHTHEYVLILHTNRPDPNRPRASIQWIYAQLFFIIISFVFWKEIP